MMSRVNTKSILDMLDAPTFQETGEEDWGDYVDPRALIDEANQAFDLAEYLENKYEMQVFSSNNGWTRKMFCPFHKNGNERTASFFINPEKNIFYCQGCGVTGGLVQFISLYSKQSYEDVASHIIKIAKEGGAILVAAEHEKKLLEKKKIVETLLNVSDLFRNFIKAYSDDELAMKYIEKLMIGFDNVYELNQESTEKNISEMYNNFKSYLKAYDRKN